MPAVSKFGAATPQTSGIVAAHLRDIHAVCRHQNTFLFVRPSTPATMRLIAAGFATKSMDIHDKSSDWGLTSGLVPVDQAFSKNLTGQPNPDMQPHAHGQAEPVHLNLKSSFDQLKAQGHFEFMAEITGASPCAGDLPTYRHFHCDQKNGTVCFLLERSTGNVFWRRRATPATLVKLYVWGYKGTPVTGDYDMWMVAPQIARLTGSNAITSNKDEHGRSAATSFTTGLLHELNLSCNRLDRPVFNHGAEAQNLSFTQPMDKQLVVFPAGLMPPFMITRVLLPGLLHDLLLHGYVVVRNPKWNTGSTLGIEDMADAAQQFPGDPMVQAGVAASTRLKQGVVASLLNRGERGMNLPQATAWQERYNQLRYFRAVARMPDPSNSLETLVLPAEAFPISGPGSGIAERQSATQLGRSMEETFTRTGFIQENGHVSPVDATAAARANTGQPVQPGSVQDRIAFYNAKG